MCVLSKKVIDKINNASYIEKFTSMPEYANTVSCTNYRIDNILLKRPNNGCTSYAIIVNEIQLGRVESLEVDDLLREALTRIKSEMINNL